MRTTTAKLGKIERFTFLMSSDIVAKHFRDYCYDNKLIMGAILESLVVRYLIEVGDINSEADIHVEKELTK